MQIDKNALVISHLHHYVPLPPEVTGRLAQVDTLIDSNNMIDSLVTRMEQQLSALHAQVMVLTRTVNAMSEVIVEIDGKDYAIGKLALQRVQLTEALTFSDRSAQGARPA